MTSHYIYVKNGQLLMSSNDMKEEQIWNKNKLHLPNMCVSVKTSFVKPDQNLLHKRVLQQSFNMF